MAPRSVAIHGVRYGTQTTWQWAMQGHAACNAVLVVTANRIGNEDWDEITINFYGPSFVADQRGEIVAQASREVEEVVAASFDCKALREERAAWGFFRVRQPPALYHPLLSH
jgi:N-carbamoylputrescine amidase